MAKALLSEAEFSRVVVNRVKRERPDIRVQPVGKYMLLVEPASGRQRMVSLADLYQSYRQEPLQRDEVIGAFLENAVYEDPTEILGTFAENRDKIMPQVVPVTLLEYCKRDNRELASTAYMGELAIAFVLDEEERYTYIHRQVMDGWAVDEHAMYQAAMENLQRLSTDLDAYYRLGTGVRSSLVWETFDGYDASRILLSRELVEAAIQVPGTPLIGIPNRDYMIMFSDVDPDFVAEVRERIREDFSAHDYPITARLFTLVDGVLVPYDDLQRQERMVN
jgi:uncharacterized protein YtpQ (UPF0354 family)